MLNNCNFTGRLTRDVELKYLGNGTPVATFTLAVNRPFKTKRRAGRRLYQYCGMEKASRECGPVYRQR